MDYKFEIHKKDGKQKRFVWSLKGPSGGVHVWAQFHENPTSWGEKCYGGCEVHYPYSPYEHSGNEPHHEKCWLLNGPCWHDGSSLYFSENIQPMVESYEDEPEKITEYVNGELLSWYESHLSKHDHESA